MPTPAAPPPIKRAGRSRPQKRSAQQGEKERGEDKPRPFQSRTLDSELLSVEERAQRLAMSRVAQLIERLRLDLANALSGDLVLLADLFERVLGPAADAETLPQDIGL